MIDAPHPPPTPLETDRDADDVLPANVDDAVADFDALQRDRSANSGATASDGSGSGKKNRSAAAAESGAAGTRSPGQQVTLNPDVVEVPGSRRGSALHVGMPNF